MNNYKAGTVIRITNEIRDKDNNFFDPDSVVISIVDPEGTSKITEAAMTKEATGQYFYNWQSAESDAAGSYLVAVKASSGGYVAISDSYLFTLH